MDPRLDAGHAEWLRETVERNRALYGGYRMMAEESGGEEAPPEGEAAATGSDEKEERTLELPADFWERPEVAEKISSIVANRVSRVKEEKVEEAAARRSAEAERKVSELETRLKTIEREKQLLELVTTHGFATEEKELLESTGLEGEKLDGYAAKLAEKLATATSATTRQVNTAARNASATRPTNATTSALIQQKIRDIKEKKNG